MRRSHRQYQASSDTLINETPPDSFYHLPFLLAYAVLDQVLGELVHQGSIPCQGRCHLLGAKMAVSKSVLRWQDYALVENGRTVRNMLAHEAMLIDSKQCFRFIDAIEVELKAWGITLERRVPSDARGEEEATHD